MTSIFCCCLDEYNQINLRAPTTSKKFKDITSLMPSLYKKEEKRKKTARLTTEGIFMSSYFS